MQARVQNNNNWIQEKFKIRGESVSQPCQDLCLNGITRSNRKINIEGIKTVMSHQI